MIRLPRVFVLWLIRCYQRFLSPDHSFWARKKRPHGYCPFYPTCSEYGHQAIKKYGLIKGILKGTWRVMRCHPWTKGGVDEV